MRGYMGLISEGSFCAAKGLRGLCKLTVGYTFNPLSAHVR